MSDAALIDRLAADLTPIDRREGVRRLALGLVVGTAVSFAIMVAWRGFRPDILEAFATGSFWLKFTYALGLAIVAAGAVRALSRPAGKAPAAPWLFAAIALAIAAIAAAQLALVEPTARAAMVMGGTASSCPLLIAALSLPILAGTAWAVRGLAPTRLTAAGLATGLAAGAAGAWVYAFSCGETAAPFVAVWYSLGIAIPAAIGALAGRTLLRW